MTIRSQQLDGHSENRLVENLDEWRIVDDEFDYCDSVVVADSEGDYELSLDYENETVGRVLGTERYAEELSEEGLAATGYSWMVGEQITDSLVPHVEEGVNYGLANQRGQLVLYDSEGNVEQLEETGIEEDGMVAYFWEEREDDTHFEERGKLHLVPSEDTDVEMNGFALDV